jgi:hypothetical protein
MKSIFFPVVMLVGIAASTVHPAHAQDGMLGIDLQTLHPVASTRVAPRPTMGPAQIQLMIDRTCKAADPSPINQRLCDLEDK